MDSERWLRIQELFHQAALLGEPDRGTFLSSSCAGDQEIRSEVSAMLESDKSAAWMLDKGIEAVAPSLPALDPIRNFGPYKLKKIIGEGGMGVVWLAERKDTENLIAIKFLPHAGLSPARRARFAAEIKTLARLRHSYIARLYDAGTLDDGTPWFAMEYVAGSQLSNYLMGKSLNSSESLTLFRKICEAVQYAHGQEIIHRDLKPSNIMVDSDGTPRLLDFGIARELHAPEGQSEQTRQGFKFFSPDYAAPEWINDGVVGLGTDVYSLGVILHQMLTGRLPSANSTPDSTELGMLCRKAIHKDPEQRYSSVEALIRDIDHFLRNERLDARRDTLRYRATKFVQRHHRAVLMTGLALILLTAEIGYVAVRLAKARNTVVAEAARTKRIQRFMLNIIGAGDQKAGPSMELKVVSLLDRGAQQATTLNADAETQAELYKTLGTMYLQLGKMPQANAMLQAAVDRIKASRGTADGRYGDALVQLSLLRGNEARFSEARQLAEQGLGIVTAAYPPGSPELASAQWALGQVLDEGGAYDDAIKVLQPVVGLQPSGEELSVIIADSFTAVGYAYQSKYQFDNAAKYFLRATELDEKWFGKTHPRVAYDYANVGTVAISVGRFAEAEKYYRQSRSILSSWYGPDHPETAEITNFLALALSQEDKLAEAEPLMQRVLAIEEAAKGKDHPLLASVLDTLGKLALRRGDLAAAESDMERALAINRKNFGDQYPQTAVLMENLGDIYVKTKRYTLGEALLRPAVKVLSAQPASASVNLAVAEAALGRSLVRQHRYGDARPYLEASYAVFSKAPERGPTRLRELREDLSETYRALHQPELER